MKGLRPASETLNNYVQRWENSSFPKDILFLAVLHQITLTLKSFSYSIEETGSRSLQVKHGGVGTRLISSGAGSLATLRIKMSFFLCGGVHTPQSEAHEPSSSKECSYPKGGAE